MIFLAEDRIAEADEAAVHLVSFSSKAQPRVVNSTLKAETYQLSDVVEAGDLIRAAFADCHGKLDHRAREEPERRSNCKYD